MCSLLCLVHKLRNKYVLMEKKVLMYLPCRWICLGINLALLFILPVSEDLVSLIPWGGKELFIHFLSFFFNWRLQQGDCLTVLNLFSELIIVFHPLYYNCSLVGRGRERQAEVFTWGVLWCCFSPPATFAHLWVHFFWCGCINQGHSSRSHVRTQHATASGDAAVIPSPALLLDQPSQSRASWNVVLCCTVNPLERAQNSNWSQAEFPQWEMVVPQLSFEELCCDTLEALQVSSHLHSTI